MSRSFSDLGQETSRFRSSTDEWGGDIKGTAHDLRGAGVGLRRVTSDLEILGIINADQYAVVRGIASSILIFSYIANTYQAVVGIVNLFKAKVAAQASVETAVHLAAQDYYSVAFALAVSGSVMAGVAGGVFLADAIERDADLETTAGQTEIYQTIQGANYGS
jgi:Na+/glutamate symporter